MISDWYIYVVFMGCLRSVNSDTLWGEGLNVSGIISSDALKVSSAGTGPQVVK